MVVIVFMTILDVVSIAICKTLFVLQFRSYALWHE